jgi:hypothetical protein
MDVMNAKTVSALRSLLSQSLENSKILRNTRELVYVERHNSVKQSFEVQYIEIFELDHDSVVQIISHENVLSAPVWDGEQKRWIGMVDVRDYLQYVLSKYGQQKSQEEAECTVDHIISMRFISCHLTVLTLTITHTITHSITNNTINITSHSPCSCYKHHKDVQLTQRNDDGYE